MLRGDFHMHTYYSYDCMTTPEALVRRCERVGLTCIAVTDHNSIGGAVAAKRIASFPVILAEEIKSAAGEITGLFLSEEIPPGLEPVETAKRIKEQGGLVSIPHPFTGMGRASLNEQTVVDLLPYVDLMEGFNARTMNASLNQKSAAFAAEHGIPVTAVSDSHTAGELGRTYTEFPNFNGSPESFKEALRSARLVTRPASPFVHFYSTINKFRRRFVRIP